MRISDWSSDVCSSDLERDILADRASPDLLRQVLGDTILDGLERQLAPLDAVVEPGNVEAEPRLDRQRADLADLEIEEEGLEFRHRRAAGDLAEIAAFLPRTAVREFPCHVGERLRALQDSRQCRLPPRLGLRRRLRIGRIGGEEDVGALIKILAEN